MVRPVRSDGVPGVSRSGSSHEHLESRPSGSRAAAAAGVASRATGTRSRAPADVLATTGVRPTVSSAGQDHARRPRPRPPSERSRPDCPGSVTPVRHHQECRPAPSAAASAAPRRRRRTAGRDQGGDPLVRRPARPCAPAPSGQMADRHPGLPGQPQQPAHSARARSTGDEDPLDLVAARLQQLHHGMHAVDDLRLGRLLPGSTSGGRVTSVSRRPASDAATPRPDRRSPSLRPRRRVPRGSSP